MTAYMTLFVADLVQDSGLLIGGSDAIESQVNNLFCRDGRGRLTMRGRGTKGALVATTRKLFGRVQDFVSGVEAQYNRARPGSTPTLPEDSPEELAESLWTVHTSHPGGSVVRLEYRESVGMRQDTKARAEGILRDFEATARGTTWPFLLEVRTYADDGERAERLAAAALLEWSRGRLWMGKDVARGLGWLNLKNLRALRLPHSRVLDWPDARYDDPIMQARKLAPDSQWIGEADFGATFEIEAVESSWRYVEIEAQLRTGPRDDGYGLEALAVGGISPTELTEGRAGDWMAPRTARKGASIAALSSSAPFAESLPATGKAFAAPLIGGGSIRGAARQELSHAARRAGETIRDPNVYSRTVTDTLDNIERSFGTIDTSAKLLVRDAHAADPAQVAWAVVQHHAEDQFSAGVFSGSKFDRAAVFGGEFDLRIVLETKNAEVEAHFLEVQLPRLLEIGRGGFLELGAGKTRGYGGAPWHGVRVRTARAGQDWQEIEEVRS